MSITSRNIEPKMTKAQVIKEIGFFVEGKKQLKDIYAEYNISAPAFLKRVKRYYNGKNPTQIKELADKLIKEGEARKIQAQDKDGIKVEIVDNIKKDLKAQGITDKQASGGLVAYSDDKLIDTFLKANALRINDAQINLALKEGLERMRVLIEIETNPALLTGMLDFLLRAKEIVDTYIDEDDADEAIE